MRSSISQLFTGAQRYVSRDGMVEAPVAQSLRDNGPGKDRH